MKLKSNLPRTNRLFIGALPLLLPALLSPLALADSGIWTGVLTTTWTTDGNWSSTPAHYPGTNVDPSTSTNTDVATFSGSGGVVNITGTADLNVGGIIFTGTPESYVIQSGNTGTGSKRIYLTVGGSVTMDSTVEKPQLISRTGISGATGILTFENNALLPAATLINDKTVSCKTTGASEVILSGSNTGDNKIGSYFDQSGTGILSVTKSGSGTWTISGSAPSTPTDVRYTGATTLNSGILGLASSGAMGSSVLTINGGTLAAAGAASRAPTNNVVVAGNFGIGGMGQDLDLQGTVDLGGATRNVALMGNRATMSGVVSNGGLTLASSNVDRSLTLSATNSYIGATTVSGGTLVVNGSISSATTVQSGARLGGNGSVGGAVTLESGGGLQAKITTWAGAPGTGYDDLTVDSFDASSAPINVNITGSLTGFVEENRSFTILNSTGTISNFAPGTVTITGTVGTGTWTLTQSVNSLVLNYTAGVADPFLSWVTSPPYNLTGGNALPTADPDADGIDNSVEFVIGGNPASGSNTNLLPTSVVTGGNLVFTYRISDQAAYLKPTVQYGSNLTGWTLAENAVNGVTISAPTAVVPAEPGIKQIVVTIPTSLGTSGKLFARLVVVTP